MLPLIVWLLICLNSFAETTESMRVLGSTHFGDHKDVLSFSDAPLPTCGTTDVLIQVSYSEVNPVDLQKLSGGPRKGQAVPNPPFVPGYGGSGVVETVGQAAPAFLVGKRVAFLGDPTRSGSYATHVAVDYRCVAEIPDDISLRDAATVPLAGCTAYESLVKLGLGPNHSVEPAKTLLIVGGAGGVSTWATLLSKAWHPQVKIISTASSDESGKWCMSQGATRTIHHNEIESLGGGQQGSMDYILCLTEPIPSIFKALSEIIRPHGSICLVKAGTSIESLNLGFCFFKSVSIVTETVFCSIRTKFKHVEPRLEIEDILKLLSCQKIKAPLSPQNIDVNWETALREGGVLDELITEHTRGKLVLCVCA